MTVHLTPYLGFTSNARSAMEFYHSVFGGDLTVSTFGDFGAPVEPAERELVMHSMLTTPIGLVLMAADTPSHIPYLAGSNFSVSLSGDDQPVLTALWEGLSTGASIEQPLEKSAWGDTFGMLVDAFGVRWLVNIAAA